MTRRRPLSIRVGRPQVLVVAAACVTLGLTAAMADREPPAPAAGAVDRPPGSALVTLQLLGVNDLHGHLEPPAPEKRGGELVRMGGAAGSPRTSTAPSAPTRVARFGSTPATWSAPRRWSRAAPTTNPR